jgi:hypothetical protein
MIKQTQYRRMHRCFHVGLFSVLVSGCYVLQPATAAEPKVGEQLAFDINDLGRVHLGGAVGPEIERIEGRLLEAPNGGYEVGVTAVHTLRGGVQVWSGERVHLDKGHIRQVYERKFSRGRTAAMSLATLAVAVAVFGKGFDVLTPNPKTVDDTTIVDSFGGRRP